MLRVLCLALLLGITQFVARAAPAPKKETGPMEIDFTPLAGATADPYDMVILVRTKGGIKHHTRSYLEARPSAADVVEHFKATIGAGWKFSVDATATKLTVVSFKNDPVESVEIKLIGEDKKHTPTVKRIPTRKPATRK